MVSIHRYEHSGTHAQRPTIQHATAQVRVYRDQKKNGVRRPRSGSDHLLRERGQRWKAVLETLPREAYRGRADIQLSRVANAREDGQSDCNNSDEDRYRNRGDGVNRSHGGECRGPSHCREDWRQGVGIVMECNGPDTLVHTCYSSQGRVSPREHQYKRTHVSDHAKEKKGGGSSPSPIRS